MTSGMTTDWRIRFVLYAVSPIVAFAKWTFDRGSYLKEVKNVIEIIRGE